MEYLYVEFVCKCIYVYFTYILDGADRFGVTPQPHLLASKWGFGHLDKAGASKIVFTNGMNDGWSAGGVTQSLSPTLIAVNIPDGAHHSDLSHSMPGPMDTADVIEARKRVKGILGGWLAETLQ
jgi:hypothetical protein